MVVQWLDMVSPHVLCVGFVDLCSYYSYLGSIIHEKIVIHIYIYTYIYICMWTNMVLVYPKREWNLNNCMPKTIHDWRVMESLSPTNQGWSNGISQIWRTAQPTSCVPFLGRCWMSFVLLETFMEQAVYWQPSLHNTLSDRSNVGSKFGIVATTQSTATSSDC